MATSYQIKSTPFFRRMVTTSKKNGQLQRLKDEYERIKDFNERTIEMRMRQVRLKRLYKEIDDIRESAMSLNKKRRIYTERQKTPEELRVESIKRAKELGTEYSRLNALMFERRLVPMPLYFSTSPQFEQQEQESKKTKERLTKSIDYGNEISRFNIRKMSLKKEKKHKLSKQTPASTIESNNDKDGNNNSKDNHTNNDVNNENDTNNNSNNTSKNIIKNNNNENDHNTTNNTIENNETTVENTKKLSQLKQRLQYGNSWSSHNMSKIPKRSKRHNIITEQPTPSTLSSQAQSGVLVASNAVGKSTSSKAVLSPAPKSPTAMQQQHINYLKSLEKLQTAEAQTNVGGPPTQAMEDARERAQRYWRKVGLAVHNRADVLRNRKMQQQRLQQQQQLQQQQHQQSSSSYAHSERFGTPPTPSECTEDTERINALHQELLLEAAAANLPPEIEHELDSEPYDFDGVDYDELPPPPPPLDPAELSAVEDIQSPPDEFEGNLDIPELAMKVQHFIKPYEKVVRAAAAKEALEFSVQSLRHVFEHKH